MTNPLPLETYLKRTTPRDSDVRGEYFRDQTAIIHSLPFRRLKHKTQVFYAPENDHVCTRIEHVLHVATIAATICKGLNRYGRELDMDLAYAIGLGHDLGHAPFGHSGEAALDKILGGNDSFIHEINSYRVVEYISNDGKGLNLTYGVKDGIICHNGEIFEQYLEPIRSENNLDAIKNRKCMPSSYEGCIMRFSDKIAYLGRDIEDALKAGFINPGDIPYKVQKELGETNGDIINSLVLDIIENSRNLTTVGFSDDKFELMSKLAAFNYKYIYNHPKIKSYQTYCFKIIQTLYDHLSDLLVKYGIDFQKYRESPVKLEQAFGNYMERMSGFYKGDEDNPKKIVTDYIAGMTDFYALDCMKQITIPSPILFK